MGRWYTRVCPMDNLLVEIRYLADDTRQSRQGSLAGTLLTYGEVARDRPERFMRGSH